jgi:hypothetical protein
MKNNYSNMKTNLLLIALSFCAFVAQAQGLTAERNAYRAGDRIVKQQVEYKDPGRSGENVVWDFGQMEPVNEEYRLAYSAARQRRDSSYILGKDTFRVDDGLIVGREHSTSYFYQLKDSVLYCLGYQNHLDLMHHAAPLPLVKFPFLYGDSIFRQTQSEDLFSERVPMFTHGDISLAANAHGMIVLPDGDTLRQVLRTRAVQNIFADSVPEMDSLQVNTTIETQRWYARGYRYPVFETIKTTHTGDTAVAVFETAFFFPPPQEYSDEPDTANIAELARMSVETLQATSSQTGNEPANPWAGMYYNVSPNPAHSDVLFEIYLPRAVNNLQVKLSNQSGLVLLDSRKGSFPEGISNFTINISSFPTGNYVIDFWLDGYLIHGSVIMKR